MSTNDDFNENNGFAASQSSLLNLPTEIVTGVFEALDNNDRKNLALAHRRLNQIEKKSGCREFDRIVYGTKPIYKFFPFWKNNGRYYEIKADNLNAATRNGVFPITSFLNRARTRNLEITGQLEQETAEKLLIALNTVKFQTLIVDFTSKINGRFISELLRNRNCGEVWIEFGEEKEEKDRLENAKEVLMGLPQMDICIIRKLKKAVTIDDDILLHLIRHSNATHFQCTTDITDNALAKAFEMVCGSKTEKYVQLLVLQSVFVEFFRQNRSQFGDYFGGYLKHLETSATLRYYIDDVETNFVRVQACTVHIDSYHKYFDPVVHNMKNVMLNAL